MVRLLCLDDEDAPDPEASYQPPPAVIKDDGRPNPNINGFSAALSCYPHIAPRALHLHIQEDQRSLGPSLLTRKCSIVSQLACLLDLNSLHDLSRTCRQFRANLLQYRTMLKALTLRCANERPDPVTSLGEAFQNTFTTWIGLGSDQNAHRFTTGKVGPCARDMVGECRKCSKIVCRNCIAKPPHPRDLKGRHRRLCKTCMKAPLNRLTSVTPNDFEPRTYSDSFTHSAFARTPCICTDNVWLCQPCGLASRQDDTNHQRSVNWRIRYSECGGIGAGLGEGNEGVECGRRRDCLAAQDVYSEHECCAEELAADGTESPGHEYRGCSYMTQEIVGIGGQLKTKVKEKVCVGHAVKHYEDERSTGRYLSREQEGLNRSWCSWCARVIPGKKDLEHPAGRSTESVNSSSSGSSM